MSQAPLPTPAPGPLDLKDIQGDVILGIPKRFEDFVFFNINDVKAFKKALHQLLPLITTTDDIIKFRKQIDDHNKSGNQDLIKFTGTNIAFSHKGVVKLGLMEKTGDEAFENGQLSRAQNLKDAGTIDPQGKFVPNWLPPFKGDIHGVFLVAGDSKISVEEGVNKVEHILGHSITEVFKVAGNVRPGKEKGHEHFGFLDGVSLPAIPAITPPLPGQLVVDPGVIVIGAEGDGVAHPAPWVKNGSFLVYRQLNQLVPEFNKFLTDNPINLPGLPRDKGSELLGARLVGRWKSGAPIDITPTQDDPALAADPQRNNNFDFSTVADQTKCPFAAHIRKTNPRTDLTTRFGAKAVATHALNRNGIPFGPEVAPDENYSNKTHHDRGLAFVCYQSSIIQGFEFVQQSWADTTSFPPFKPVTPGFDPIIGQNGNDARSLVGTNPSAQTDSLPLPFEFVVSKGGEYFFSPSITALKTNFST